MPLDEEQRVRASIFADGTQSIYLADMTGDGLSDIVRIRNGEVCYWPNLRLWPVRRRRSRWIAAPWFDTPDLFDQRRIRLADTDGSGTTDILYLGRDGSQVYLNEIGQRAGAPPGASTVSRRRQPRSGRRRRSPRPRHGVPCLVVAAAGRAGRQLRYLDLMCGRKPHLLDASSTTSGAETRIEYASSTEFYLADKAAGTPWVTRLPFPVHVVEARRDLRSRSAATASSPLQLSPRLL